MTCPQCGAELDPAALSCPYCELMTPAGVAAQQREAYELRARAEREAAAQQQQRVAALARMNSAATQSLVFALAGLIVMCTPAAIVGVVQGARARSMASALDLPLPGRGVFGLVLSTIATATSVAFLGWAVFAGRQDVEDGKARAAALERRLGERPALATLDRDTACQLAELHALNGGWKGTAGYYLETFECGGRFNAAADHAELEDFGFSHIDDRFRLSVCFKRGVRWYVGEMREGPCPTPSP